MKKQAAHVPIITPLVGRVLTNLVKPYSYTTEGKINTILKNYKKIIPSLVHDTPIYETITRREVPYRLMFGLSPRKFSDEFAIDSAEKVITPTSKRIVNTIKRNIANESPDNLMGYFDKKIVGDKIEYSDTWDFKLNEGEKIDSFSNFLRAAIDKITSPYKIKGEISNIKNTAELETEAKVLQHKLNKLHPQDNLDDYPIHKELSSRLEDNQADYAISKFIQDSKHPSPRLLMGPK